MDQYFVELPEKEPENIPDFVGLANLKKNDVSKSIFCINSVLDNTLRRFFKISRYLPILIVIIESNTR